MPTGHCKWQFCSCKYTVKFRKYAVGLIFFKGHFWGAYFWGLIYGAEICVSKSIGLGTKFTIFFLFFFCIWGQFPSRSPRWPYIWRGDFGGAHTRRDLFREFYGIYDRECRILPSLLRQRCFKQSHKIMHKLLLGNYRVTLISWMRYLQGDLLQKIAR